MAATKVQDVVILELDTMGEARNGDVQQLLKARSGCGTVPQVFVGGVYQGGGDDMIRMQRDGSLMRALQEAGCNFA